MKLQLNLVLRSLVVLQLLVCNGLHAQKNCPELMAAAMGADRGGTVSSRAQLDSLYNAVPKHQRIFPQHRDLMLAHLDIVDLLLSDTQSTYKEVFPILFSKGGPSAEEFLADVPELRKIVKTEWYRKEFKSFPDFLDVYWKISGSARVKGSKAIQRKASAAQVLEHAQSLGKTFSVEPGAFFRAYADHFPKFPLLEIVQVGPELVEALAKVSRELIAVLRPIDVLHSVAGINATPMEYMKRLGRFDLDATRVFEGVAEEVKKPSSPWQTLVEASRNPRQAVAETLGKPVQMLRTAIQDRRLFNERFLPSFIGVYLADLHFGIIAEILVRGQNFWVEFPQVATNVVTFAICDAFLSLRSAYRGQTAMARAVLNSNAKETAAVARHELARQLWQRGVSLTGAGVGASIIGSTTIQAYEYFYLGHTDVPVQDRILRVIWNAAFTGIFLGVWSNVRYTMIYDHLSRWLGRQIFFERAAGPTVASKIRAKVLGPAGQGVTMAGVGLGNSFIGSYSYTWFQTEYLNPLYDSIFHESQEEMGLEGIIEESQADYAPDSDVLSEEKSTPSGAFVPQDVLNDLDARLQQDR